MLRKKKIQYITNSPSETRKLGEDLAKEILRKGSQNTKAFVIALIGDLGGGKTTFLKGFAKGLGIKEKILSPTFVLMKKFSINNQQLTINNFCHFYHIDCYRIQKPKEILDLGFKEIVSNPKNIVAIEWADYIRKILPKNILLLKFKFINKNKRKITYDY